MYGSRWQPKLTGISLVMVFMWPQEPPPLPPATCTQYLEWHSSGGPSYSTK